MNIIFAKSIKAFGRKAKSIVVITVNGIRYEFKTDRNGGYDDIELWRKAGDTLIYIHLFSKGKRVRDLILTPCAVEITN